MKFFTRSDARSAANRAQAKSKHIMLDSVLNEAIKNQERQNSFDIFLSHAVKVIYAELSGDFPLGDSRQPTYKSLRPFDLVS